MEDLEIAAAALQLTSVVVRAFRVCILAIEFFNTAQQVGADGDLFRTGLELEKYRLMRWAEIVGLLDDHDDERQSLNWQLSDIILGQLESILTSAAVLKARYSLDVTEEEVDATDAQAPKQGIPSLITRLKPNLGTMVAKIIEKQNSPIKRFRCQADRDGGKLKAFLADINNLINKLEFLLDQTGQKHEKEEYDRLLREVISLATTAAEAGQVKEFLDDASPYHRQGQESINATAYIKQVRLVLGADKRDDEVTPKSASDTVGLVMPKLVILNRPLTTWPNKATTTLFQANLEFATYRQKQVLIQWKPVESTQWECYTKQMKCLAVFLMSLSVHKSFRSLPCLGHYPCQPQARHGIVYAMPDGGSGETDWDFKTLRDLIKDQPFVSLKRRLALAKTLADVVLQLHTAGWLHKNLCSKNILFLATRGSSDDVFLASEPYIVGYEYARSDTSDAAVAFTQLPDTELEADLYRHPLARGVGRETYQKRFDLYAMACVVVELVMWKPLVEIFSEHRVGTGDNADLKDLIATAQAANEVIELPELRDLFEKNEAAVRVFEHHAGPAVLEIVRACYSAQKPEEGDEGLLTEQIAAVEKLGWCRL
ncbi:prion-inhibition and propagation-domain-containing protein [Rhypophila decipiens]|uniref:Prion-inhibition and propagation-domain-containing protein n=1 Tax=Rhypophila decipiens TaxID=261697 RepID=A0AAN7B1I2_9PEZI|nr:prion-inhibition and propagation-domain-containing protein [Rhypophila decipiens]